MLDMEYFGRKFLVSMVIGFFVGGHRGSLIKKSGNGAVIVAALAMHKVGNLTVVNVAVPFDWKVKGRGWGGS